MPPLNLTKIHQAQATAQTTDPVLRWFQS